MKISTSTQPQPYLAPEEYLAIEREADPESTQDYDRGSKFAQYRSLDSFAEYLLIAQDKPHVEHCIRQPDNRWLLEETDNLEDTIELTSIGCQLTLSDIYAKVEFEGQAHQESRENHPSTFD